MSHSLYDLKGADPFYSEFPCVPYFRVLIALLGLYYYYVRNSRTLMRAAQWILLV